MAFRTAASMTVREAARRAKPVILEPVMRVEIRTPEQFFGDVMGDVSRRRGNILGSESLGAMQIVRAEIPLSEMFGYTTDLRSLTQGRATNTMEFDHYEPVPANIAQSLIKGKG
jgi:elongation factor G